VVFLALSSNSFASRAAIVVKDIWVHCEIKDDQRLSCGNSVLFSYKCLCTSSLLPLSSLNFLFSCFCFYNLKQLFCFVFNQCETILRKKTLYNKKENSIVEKVSPFYRLSFSSLSLPGIVRMFCDNGPISLCVIESIPNVNMKVSRALQ